MRLELLEESGCSLCLCAALSVSVVRITCEKLHHRDTESHRDSEKN